MTEKDSVKLNGAVYCTPQEIERIRKLVEKGYYVYLQQVPSDPEVDVKDVLK